MYIEWGWWRAQGDTSCCLAEGEEEEEEEEEERSCYEEHCLDSDGLDRNDSKTCWLSNSPSCARLKGVQILARSRSVVILNRSESKVLKAYLVWRVQQGTAADLGAATYELNGQSNEVLEDLRLIMHCDGNHELPLRLPDSMQHLKKLIDNSSGSNTDLVNLEETFDIVRLHRLGDDLDILSLLNLRLASKTLGVIAARALQTRVQNLQLFLTPFVDGCDLSGRSVFDRVFGDENETETVIHREAHRSIEYMRCKDIQLSYQGDEGSHCKFIPYRASHFSWNCQELGLNNLDRMIGIVAMSEYVGQKLSLYWRQTGPDTQFSPRPMKIADLNFGAAPRLGRRSYRIHESSVEIHVRRSNAHQLNDVTTQYTGLVSVERVNLNLGTLCHAVLAYGGRTSQPKLNLPEHPAGKSLSL